MSTYMGVVGMAMGVPQLVGGDDQPRPCHAARACRHCVCAILSTEQEDVGYNSLGMHVGSGAR